MAKQIQIGRDKLVFTKVQNIGSCDVTPTPTPTSACLTINLDTQITCDEYNVLNAYRSSSSNKLIDAMIGPDNSILACGVSLCGSIVNTSNISESTICKTKIETISDNEGGQKRAFVLDTTFSNNGKINQAFYDTSNLKVPSKFTCMIPQIASGQNKVIVGGENNNKPLIGRYILSTGSEDRTFGFNTGFITLDTIANDSIRLINVFGLALQTDNRILVFCNAYDISKKHSLCVVIRLTNSGLLDTTFNQNEGYIALRSSLPEFDGNRIVGIKIKKINNFIYIIAESFSSLKKNTIIVTRYLLNESSIDATFGNNNFIYINIDDKDTYYHTLFEQDDSLFVVANSQNRVLHIVPHKNTGEPDTEKTTLKINNDIFSIIDRTAADPNGVLNVNFLNMPCEEVIIDNNIILGVNVNILSNSINILGPNNNSGFHWFEKQALTRVDAEYDSVEYRDCAILPCDRQPQDSYGTLVINNQKITKYYTPSRILYGLISISKDLSSASGMKLDRFDNLSPHNILKSITKLENSYIATGYSGDNFYSAMSMKTLSLTPNSTSFGPDKSDVVGLIDFDDSCPTAAAAVQEFVVEECPCAPAPTPTPTPTPILPTSEVYISDILGECQGDIPVLSVSWVKNNIDLIGNYVIQIVRNNPDRPEILASTFSIARAVNSDKVQLPLTNIAPELNNRTCIANIIDSSGNTVHSKIFVLSISVCPL